jgi:hypothetical protein
MVIKDPSRLAWTVLITALIVFCLTATALVAGVRWFLFDSSIPLNVELTVGRNTVSVRPDIDSNYQSVRTSSFLSQGAILNTDSSSQGFVAFTDPYTHEVIASLTLHRSTTLTLIDAHRPRFDFSTGAYLINIEFEGDTDISIVPDLPRNILFDVDSDHGLIRLGDTGQYILTSQSDIFSVLNRAGEAVIINTEPQAWSVAPGWRGRITTGSSAVALDQPVENILPDGSFDEVNPASVELSSSWRCYNEREDYNSPEGVARKEVVNGRAVMHITRAGQAGQSARNHGATGCLQYLYTVDEPQPIVEADYLELRVSMQLREREATLSTCGQNGSECPVMVEINYINQYDQPQRWIHGFYSRYDPAVGWPLRCPSCSQDHEQLNKDTWYTYSSGNLLQLLPEGQRPAAISSVEFYASGHEYDVLLGEVVLFAGNFEEETIATDTGETVTED